MSTVCDVCAECKNRNIYQIISSHSSAIPVHRLSVRIGLFFGNMSTINRQNAQTHAQRLFTDL